MSEELKIKGTEPGLPGWKKALLAVAAVFVLVGAALLGFGALSEESSSTSSAGGSSASAMTNSLVSSSKQGSVEAADDGSVSSWSPFFLKGGFSLFFGFAIGYALRTFFKFSLVFLGLAFLLMLGLEYVGVLDINMDAFAGFYDKAVAKVQSEAGAFKSFVTGSLPSAGLGALGLFAGFKKG